MNSFNFYNSKHLGDSVFLTHYLIKVCQNYSHLNFNLYLPMGHHSEIQSQINCLKDSSNRIKILPLKNLKNLNHAINGWYGWAPLGNYGKVGKIFYLNERFDKFYEILSDKLSIKNPIPGKKCILMDNPAIQENVDLECDVLLINSKPFSGQYWYSKADFVEKAYEWKEQYSLVSTFPLKNLSNEIPCTLDYNLNLLQIGNISTKAKHIVSVATAPIIHCFNIWNIDKVQSWHVLSKRSSYSFCDRIIRKNNVKYVTLEKK